MNDMIEKLSDIEHTAASIMDAAHVRKKEAAKEMEDETAAFDRQLEAETASQISILKAKMETDMQAKLSAQRTVSLEILKELEDTYQTNHEALVKELFETMTER